MAWNEQQRAALSQKRGQAAAYITNPAQRAAFIQAQGQAEESTKAPNNAFLGQSPSDEAYTGMSNEADQTIATQGQNFNVAGQQPKSYRKGTPFVKRTGPAILHRGEAVVPRRKAAAMRKRNAFFGE